MLSDIGVGADIGSEQRHEEAAFDNGYLPTGSGAGGGAAFGQGLRGAIGDGGGNLDVGEGKVVGDGRGGVDDESEETDESGEGSEQAHVEC